MTGYASVPMFGFVSDSAFFNVFFNLCGVCECAVELFMCGCGYWFIPQIIFSYVGSYGVGPGALPVGALRASCAPSHSCAQAAGTVRVTSLPST